MSYPCAAHRYPEGLANRINGKIRARETRAIGPNGQPMGIQPLTAALQFAQVVQQLLAPPAAPAALEPPQG